MRLILFFDLPTLTAKNRKDYRDFVKNLKKMGFFMLQESVYIKLVIDGQASELTMNKIKKVLPKDGNVDVLVVTEKQFSEMRCLLGENSTDVINTDERFVEL